MTIHVQAQPSLIPPSLPGLIDFWYNGVRAARTHMTYAVSAVKAGQDLDYFVEAAHTQARFLEYTNREIDASSNGPPCFLRASPADRFMLEFIKATNMTRDLWFLPEIERIPHDRRRALLKRAANLYHATSSLRELVWDIAHSNVARFGAKKIMVAVYEGRDTYVRDISTRARVRRAFDRLIEIGALAINPASKNRDIQILFNPLAIEFMFSGVTGGTTLAEEVANDASLRELGWKCALRSDDSAVAYVTLYPHKGDLVRSQSKFGNTIIVPNKSVLPVDTITQGAEVFMDAAPFAFYSLVSADDRAVLDVSSSPLYRNILRAREIVAAVQPQEFFPSPLPRPPLSVRT